MRFEATYATTTATMTSGTSATPSDCMNNAVIRTEVNGSPQHHDGHRPDAHGGAGDQGQAGRWDSAMPPAAPMNMPGNVGPPRKALSDAA
jgi:hypothetical protein